MAKLLSFMLLSSLLNTSFGEHLLMIIRLRLLKKSQKRLEVMKLKKKVKCY